MSTLWKQCSVFALRILHAQGKKAVCCCSSLYSVEVSQAAARRIGYGATSLRRFANRPEEFGMSPWWLAGDQSFHRYSNLATTEVNSDVDVEVAVPRFTEADRESSFEFLTTLGIKTEKLTRLVKKYPLVMSVDFKDGIVSLLGVMKRFGVSEQLVPRILDKNPQLILRIIERNVFIENLTYLNSCGLTSKQLERVVRFYPQSLSASKELQLQPTVEFMLGLGVTEAKIGKVVSLSPYYLGYRHDISLQPKVAFFLSLGVKRESLGKLIMEQPSLLCLSIGENVMPKLKYLESVGVQRARLGEMICRYPAVLTSNLDTMKLKLEFFGSKGLKGKNLVNLLTLHPDLLGKSLESLRSGFVNVQNIGFTQEEVCSILKMHPTILSSTETHLQKKFEFLTNVMNRSLKEVLTFTAFVTYSLERRIKPRHRVFAWLLAEGLLPQKSYSLRTIIGGSEEYFKDRYLVLHPLAESMYKDPLEASAG